MKHKNYKIIISAIALITIIIVLVIQYSSKQSVGALIQSEKSTVKSAQLLNTIESIKSEVLLQESRVRGYILTNNQKLTEGSVNFKERINIYLDSLNTITLNEKQKQLEKSLRITLNEKFNFQDSIISSYKKSRLDAIKLINTEKGKIHTDSIVSICNKIKNIEQAELINIIKNVEQLGNNVLLFDYDATIIAIIIIIISAIILFIDITIRVRLEYKLREEQKKAIESIQFKEQFMANMSHEIRTPLGIVIGFTNQLTKTNLDANQKEYVKTINTAGENLLNLVNDILDYSKIEAGMLTIEKTPFNLRETLQTIYTFFWSKAKENKIDFQLHIDDKCPKIIIGAPNRLTQILTNLISNALKFTPTGSITIKVDVISLEHEKVNIKFSIIDTGIGIAKGKQKIIFDRFVQENNDTTRKFGGTGLGLSIAKKLIELQNGEINLISEIGKGSAFTFNIPYEIDNNEILVDEQSKSNKKSLKFNNIKALIVEDNILNQKIFKMMLDEFNVEYEIANSGIEAINKLINNTQYDIVFMDIQMPEMDGYEATKQIRETLKLNTLIVATTAKVMPHEKEKCINGGMNEYLSKPINEKELAAIFNKYFEINKTTSSKVDENNERITNTKLLFDLSNGNNVFIHEMISLFIEQTQINIQELDIAIKTNNIKKLSFYAHKIKSSIHFVGIDNLLIDNLNELEQFNESEINSNINDIYIKTRTTLLKAIDELRNEPV